MIKIIPREKIKHLEWQEGEEIPKENPIKNTPKNFPSENVSYSFLEGDFGKTILEEYKMLVKEDYKNASALNVLSFEDNVVKGSNPFAFVTLNKILKSHGKWIARPKDLERALENDSINLKGTYGDSGLVLRSEGDPNEYLAKNLIEQIKERQTIEYPLMIPLAEINLVYDSKSPNNLSFKLTDSTELIYVHQFEHKNDHSKFDKADDKGLPIFDTKGKRTLYTGEGGLRRLYRGRISNLDARNWYLAYSYFDGRVVVCAEGASP